MNALLGTEYMVSIEELKQFKTGYNVQLSDKVTFVKYYEDAIKCVLGLT
jgi:hypothetical protein